MTNNFTTPVREHPLARLDDNKPLHLRNFPTKPTVGAAPPQATTDKALGRKDPAHDKRRKKTKPSTLCMTPPSLITDTVGVNYHRGLCIGEGGFARCFQVRNGNDEIFAAKTVAKAALVNVKTKEKLITEIDIHRQLEHPNLVKFIDCFEDTENVYMLLEMCSNRSLADLVHRRRQVTEPEARFWFLQMLGAVGYMHSRGIVHRDLKLGNIFLDKNLNIKVGDFGLAAVVEKDRRRYTVCGTPNYISPEVLRKPHAHGQSVDIWALGIILYSMLVGRPPFQDREVDRIYERIRTYESGFPAPPSTQYQDAWNGVSEDAREFVAAMLNPDPMMRPTFAQCLKSRWLNTGVCVSSIPLTALTSEPTLDLSGTNSHNNYEILMKRTQLDVLSGPRGNLLPSVRPRVSNRMTTDRLRPVENGTIKTAEYSSASGAPIPVGAATGTASSATSAAAAAAVAIGEQRVLPNHISPPSTKDKYKPVAVPDEARAQVQQRNVPVYDSPVVGRKLVSRDSVAHPNVNSPMYTRQQRVESMEKPQNAHQFRELFPVSAMRTSTTATSSSNYIPNQHLQHPGGGVSAQRLGSVNGPPRMMQRPVEAVHRNVVDPLYATLRSSAAALEEGLRVYTSMPETTITSQSLLPPPLVVTRWADFEESWGISYCFSDGSVGMLFRDGTTLRSDPLLRTYSYYESRSKPGFLTMHRVSEDTTDPKRRKKLKVLTYVKEYMDRELAHAFEFDRRGGDVSVGETLHYIQKVRGMIMFVHTDGTVQFNFRDHTKLIVHDKGTKLAFITDARQLYSCTLETSIRATNSAYLKRYNFVEKLQTIRDILYQCSAQHERKLPTMPTQSS